MKAEIIKRENKNIANEYLLVIWSGDDVKISNGYEASKNDLYEMYIQLGKLFKDSEDK